MPKDIFPNLCSAERHFPESSFSRTSFSRTIICPNVILPKFVKFEIRDMDDSI